MASSHRGVYVVYSFKNFFGIKQYSFLAYNIIFTSGDRAFYGIHDN